MSRRRSSAPAAGVPSDRVLRYYIRDPNKAYRDFHLWVPAAIGGTAAVLGGLTLETSTGTLVLYRKAGSHYILPRHYPWQGEVVNLPVEVDRIQYTDGVTLRPNQVDAFAAFAAAPNGTLELSCGKGKTVLACKKIAHEGLRALVVAPAGVVPQWVSEIERFLGFTPGVVQGQSRQEWETPVVVASSKTLAAHRDRIPLELRTRFGLIIYDECHHLSASELSTIAPMFIGKRYGLTATVKRADGTESAYLHQLGHVFYTDTTQELTPSVYFVRLDTEADMKDREILDCTGALNIPRLRKKLGVLDVRNQRIAAHIRQAVANGRRVLALTHSVDGAYALQAVLGEDMAAVVTGRQRNGQKRLEAFKGDKVVIASTEIAGEALDAPHLDTLFLLTPFTTTRLLTQAPGRVLRKKEGKERPIVVVFEDAKIPPLRAMCRTMRREFISSKYDVENVPDVIDQAS